MKRNAFWAMVLFFLTLSWAAHSQALTYDTTLISEFLADNYLPSLNDYGQIAVAEYGGDYNKYGIYRYDTADGTRTNIISTFVDFRRPVINNVGQIAWYAGLYLDVYTPGNTYITRVIDSETGGPSYININDAGIVTYTKGSQLFRFDTSSYVVSGYTYYGSALTLENTTSIEIINSTSSDLITSPVWSADFGKAAWIEFVGGADSEIKFYDGASVTQLSNNSIPDGDISMNSSGDMVWIQGSGFDLDLMYYDSGTQNVSQLLPSNYLVDWNPMISDGGDILFKGNETGNLKNNLYLTDGSGVSLLASNAFDQYMTSNGNIVWAASDGSDTEIFFYNSSTGEIIQITDNDFNDQSPKLNESGDIVWLGYPSTYSDLFVYNFAAGEIFNISNSPGTDEPLNFQLNESGEVLWFFSGQRSIYFSSPVPIPPAVWLFASGLIGIIGIKRKLKK